MYNEAKTEHEIAIEDSLLSFTSRTLLTSFRSNHQVVLHWLMKCTMIRVWFQRSDERTVCSVFYITLSGPSSSMRLMCDMMASQSEHMITSPACIALGVFSVSKRIDTMFVSARRKTRRLPCFCASAISSVIWRHFYSRPIKLYDTDQLHLKEHFKIYKITGA